MQADQTPTEGNHSDNQETEGALDDATCSASVLRCPSSARYEGDLVGCGSTNVSEPDEEGLCDCLDCGIWFPAAEELCAQGVEAPIVLDEPCAVWLVTGESGEYDDSDEWRVAAFTSKVFAEHFRDLCVREADKAAKSKKCNHAYDARYTHADTTYHVSEEIKVFSFLPNVKHMHH